MLQLVLELIQEKVYHVGLSFIICKMEVVIFVQLLRAFLVLEENMMKN